MIASIITAWILPAIPGWFSTTNNYTTYRTCMLVGSFFFGIGFILSLFIKESCPYVLARREAKKLKVKFHPKIEKGMTWGATFKFIFKN